MMRRNLVLVALFVLGLGAALVLYLLGISGSGPLAGISDPQTTDENAEARDALLASSWEIDLNLAVDIPKRSESDNPNHQEIDAQGVLDLRAGHGELTYDFNGLNNSAGYLGHFETMDMILEEDGIYLEVFHDGPPWLRVVPDDIGVGDVARLREMLFTVPLILPDVLETEAIEEEVSDSEVTRTVVPSALAMVPDRFAAAIGTVLERWKAKVIDVEVALEEGIPESFVVSFSYRPDGAGKRIEVVATYTFTPTDTDPTVQPPDEADVREYRDVL